MAVSGGLLSMVVAWRGVLSTSSYNVQRLFKKISCKLPQEMKGRRSCLRPSGKKSKLKKKVRFAPNVVEPRCNNKGYRRRRKRIVARMMSSSEESVW